MNQLPPIPPKAAPSSRNGGHDDANGDEREFDWLSLVTRVVHPTKVAIIEALLWIDQPLSATDLTKVFGGELGLGVVAYHLRELYKAGVMSMAGDRQVRGAREKFYVFST
jgi:DNA-binding transcriptional ArsR family regulator